MLFTDPPTCQLDIPECLFVCRRYLGTRDLNKDKRPGPCRVQFGRRQTCQPLIALSAMINVCTRWTQEGRGQEASSRVLIRRMSRGQSACSGQRDFACAKAQGHEAARVADVL